MILVQVGIHIKELASFIGIKYILDRFHAIREFRKLFLLSGKYNGKKSFKIPIDLFYSSNYYDLMELLKIEDLKEVFKYFRNNMIGIINQGAKWNIGVSAKSDVSRLVGYGSKVYSLVVLKKY